MCCLNLDLFRYRFENTWIGQLDPIKARKVSSVMTEFRAKGTYDHYVSQFRQWVIYCDDFNVDPLSMPPDPYLYIF